MSKTPRTPPAKDDRALEVALIGSVILVVGLLMGQPELAALGVIIVFLGTVASLL